MSADPETIMHLGGSAQFTHGAPEAVLSSVDREKAVCPECGKGLGC